MPDTNFLDQAGNFATDGAIDTAVDGVVNQALDAVVSRVPGGDAIAQMLTTEVDQNVNNAINSEINKGISGMMQDVEGLFGH